MIQVGEVEGNFYIDASPEAEMDTVVDPEITELYQGEAVIRMILRESYSINNPIVTHLSCSGLFRIRGHL